LYLSQKNKMISGEEDKEFLGEDKEFLIQYSKEKLKTEHIDYFVFGHRHLPMILEVGAGASYVNLGDWISYYSYGVFDGAQFQLKYLSNL
ncbi:UDP-2,3-diacylglucosamine diphosphatase, partial [Escherichia coli]|nr:UDP-2,3-diacylglucosamine diphosphatase [Escherichia coli]